MESKEEPQLTKIEKSQTSMVAPYRIEHLANFDVILNMNNPRKEEELELIFDILRNTSLVVLPIGKILDKNNNPQFYGKMKYSAQENTDFIRGRTDKDPLPPEFAFDFDKRSRYALAGVLSEILLSEEIKNIVNSESVRELAKKYGFASMKFSEPIMGIIRKGSGDKYMIYENIISTISYKNFSEEMQFKITHLAEELRNIFISKGIIPHDLRLEQFILSKDQAGGDPYLTLIDTEAYTKEKPTEKEST